MSLLKSFNIVDHQGNLDKTVTRHHWNDLTVTKKTTADASEYMK